MIVKLIRWIKEISICILTVYLKHSLLRKTDNRLSILYYFRKKPSRNYLYYIVRKTAKSKNILDIYIPAFFNRSEFCGIAYGVRSRYRFLVQ